MSDDWSSTGFLEANAELEASMGMAEQNKFRDRREKERQKEAAEGGVESPEGGPRRLSKWELYNLPTCRAQRGG